jgi:HK97 family phage prohead protease
VPVHWDHRGEAEKVIGSIDPTKMTETDEGLHVEGKLDLEDSEVAREAWRSMKNGTIALSFGYLVLDDRKRDDGVRELLEIDLFEVTLTPSPANPETRIVSMKSAAPAWTEADSLALDRFFSHPAWVNAGRPTEEQMSKDFDEVLAKAAKRNRPVQIKTFEV